MRKTLLGIALCLICTLMTEGATRRRSIPRLGSGSATIESIRDRIGKYPRPGTIEEKNWTWVTTYTTNDNQKVTIVTEGTCTDGRTKTIYCKWNDEFVPFHMREIFSSLSDNDKGMALSSKQELWTTPVEGGTNITPKKENKSPTDSKLTKEITEIKLRW